MVCPVASPKLQLARAESRLRLAKDILLASWYGVLAYHTQPPHFTTSPCNHPLQLPFTITPDHHLSPPSIATNPNHHLLSPSLTTTPYKYGQDKIDELSIPTTAINIAERAAINITERLAPVPEGEMEVAQEGEDAATSDKRRRIAPDPRGDRSQEAHQIMEKERI